MVKAIYRVKVPDPEQEGEYKIYEFDSPKKVCETLNIPLQTLYSIVKGRIKYKHKSVEHMKNIIVEKEVVEVKKRTKKERPTTSEYEKSIINKLEKL